MNTKFLQVAQGKRDDNSKTFNSLSVAPACIALSYLL